MDPEAWRLAGVHGLGAGRGRAPLAPALGNLGAEVVRRGPTQWPVRITPLGPDRAAIGKPVELGVYRTLAQAQFHADIELNVDRTGGTP